MNNTSSGAAKRQLINMAVFLLAISTVLTALPDLLIPIFIPYKEFIVTPMLEIAFLFYLFFMRKGDSYSIVKRDIMFIVLMLLPLFVMYLFEPIRYLIKPGRASIYILVNFFSIIVFFVYYVANMSCDETFIHRTLRAYWLFNYVIALSAAVVFLMLHAGVISVDSWGLPSSFSEHFKIKYDIAGANNVYSVPFSFVVILPGYLKPLGFFSTFGTFSGLSYEPHIATFFMSPAFFLTFRYYRTTFANFIKFFLPFIVFFLLASSLSNIIALAVVGIVLLLIRFNLKTMAVVLFIGVICGYIISIYYDRLVDFYTLISPYIESKFSGRSTDETSGFLSYILRPHSFVGWGPFNVPTYFDDNYDDIGLIGCVLMVLLYGNLIYLIIKNLFKKNIVFAAMGMYFLFHSMKFPLYILQMPFIVFIFIILSLAALDSSFQRYPMPGGSPNDKI